MFKLSADGYLAGIIVFLAMVGLLDILTCLGLAIYFGVKSFH